MDTNVFIYKCELQSLYSASNIFQKIHTGIDLLFVVGTIRAFDVNSIFNDLVC